MGKLKELGAALNMVYGGEDQAGEFLDAYEWMHEARQFIIIIGGLNG